MSQLHTFGANRDLVAEFNRRGVRFLLVGGLAVQYYVPDRHADDLDLLVESTDDNAERIYSALQALHLNPQFPKEALSLPGKKQLPLKTIHYADLLTPEPGVIDFCAEWERASSATIGVHPVRVASRQLLVRMKSGSDRPRDVQDIELLSKIDG